MRRSAHRRVRQPAAAEQTDSGPTELVNSVAGAASFVGSLLLYAGYIYINSYFGYFHLDSFAVGFSPFELIVRSLRLATLPAFVVLAIVLLIPGVVRRLAALQVSERYVRRVRRASRVVARAHAAIAVAGVVLLFLWPWIQPYGWTAPILIAIGLLLGRTPAAIAADETHGPTWERAASLLIAGLFLIWGVALLARQLGQQDAQQDAQQLVRRTAVVIVSTDRLSMTSPGLVVDDLGRGVHYRYRYSGLRLLIERNQRYYLVSLGWRQNIDPTFVIDKGDSIRIELRPGTQPRS
ncbi:hypothetical protein [Streptomyces chartreusis]